MSKRLSVPDSLFCCVGAEGAFVPSAILAMQNKCDKKVLKRINMLIKDIDRNPYEGIGKPELLKANLQGYLSRKIDSEHRIVYAAENSEIVYISFRFHYD